APPARPSPIPPPNGVTPLNLLLVEDSEVNREVAHILLTSWGHTVTMAENGLRALELLPTQTFDAILMDCQMPELDGYETTRRIRSSDHPGIPQNIHIIAMTANAMPGDRDICLNVGMNDYVGKPIDESELLAALQKAAQHRPTPPLPSPPPPEPEPSLALDPPSTNPPPVNASRFPPRLAALFVRETRKRHQEIITALEAADLEAVARVAHTIKGTAGNFGADDLYQLCRQIETAARSGDLAAARETLPHLAQIVDSVCLAWSPHAEPAPA
ncbi:MAG: response regulator, partial [Verrucomicrobiia bacterium]